MNYNISSENLNNPFLKDLLKELNNFFGNLNMDFYVIGATARDIILSNLHGLIPERKTVFKNRSNLCSCFNFKR